MNLLLISNSKASLDNPNGKTILNFAKCFPDVKIYNFFCGNSQSRDEDGIHYLQVTDQDALNILLHRKKRENLGTTHTSNPAKSGFKQLARFWVWKLSNWQKHTYKKWLSNVTIDAVLIYAGDAPYLLGLACKETKKRRIPLFVFTGENYAFKRFDYMKKKTKADLGYKAFHQLLYRKTKQACKRASAVFLNSDLLKEEYIRQFNLSHCYTAYPMSEKKPMVKAPKKVKNILYGGGFGLKRYESICEIADLCYKQNKEITIHVYGSGDETAVQQLSIRPNIILHGVVPSSVLDDRIREADLLIHCESFDPYLSEDLKFAFSTKIVESLMSGTPFMIYAPKHMAGTEYCSKRIKNYCITSRDELKNTLPLILNGLSYETDYEQLIKCHSVQNQQRIKEIVSTALPKHGT